MGILDKNSRTKANWRKVKETRSVLSFSLIFLISFFALMFAPNAIKNIPNQMIISFANSFIDKYSNNQFDARTFSKYNYDESLQTAKFTATYYQPIKNQPPGAQKIISVNMNLEYYLPIVLLLSLILAYKQNFTTKILSGEAILLLYLLFKIIAVAFDNYNYPEAAIIKLGGIFGGCVYYFNYFLNLVGTSPNFLIPIAICAILYYKDIEKNI